MGRIAQILNLPEYNDPVSDDMKKIENIGKILLLKLK